MSTEVTFYPTEPLEASGDFLSSFDLGNGFAPEFLSLALLEKGNQHSDMSDSIPPNNQVGTTQAVIPDLQGEMNRPRLRNRQLLPVPADNNQKRSIDFQMNQSQAFFHTYPSMTNLTPSTFVGSDDREYVDFGFDNTRSSGQNSELSSNKSSSPVHSWQNDETVKREKHLERNRAAASKSRQKKKRETDKLKTRYQEVSRKRKELEEEIKSLHSNLISLKDQILMHSQCDDKAIHLYLGQMFKQATKLEVSTAEGDNERGGSNSPLQDGFQQHQSMLELPTLRMDADEPMMSQMMDARPGNIFDYQISIS